MTTYPDVPNAPGVPQLARNPADPPPPPPSFLTEDGPGAPSDPSSQLWGVFKGATPVVVADTVTGFDYGQSWAIASYPVEKGGFESYDKVSTPFETRVRFTTGGTLSDRETLLQSIESIAGKLDLYDVVTPEATYLDANVRRYDYSREDGNAGMIHLDVFLMEVRQTAEAAFSTLPSAAASPTAPAPRTIASPKSPPSASQVNNGTVQASPLGLDPSRFFGSGTLD